MKYKNFGLYTNKDTVFLVVDTNYEDIIYIVMFQSYPLEPLRNKHINDILEFEGSKFIGKEQVFRINTLEHSDVLENCAYIGQINSIAFQRDIEEHLHKIKPVIKTFGGSTWKN